MSLNDFQQANAIGPTALYILPQGESRTYAPLNTPPKQVVIPSLAISSLLGAMTKMGWATAAALMQRWFDSPAWAMPEAWKKRGTQPHPRSLRLAHCDERIVKMEWAMKFERCQVAVKELEFNLTTTKAIERLSQLLKVAGWDGITLFELGSVSMSALQLDAHSQVNAASFGGVWDVLDDMYGALGAATLKVGVVGKAVRTKHPATGQAQYLFHIEHIGFYIRDHYDFNGFQYLGTWTENRVLTKPATVVSMTPHGEAILRLKGEAFAAITNSHFREYRSKTGKGGDFMIYSDVLWRQASRTIDLGEWN